MLIKINWIREESQARQGGKVFNNLLTYLLIRKEKSLKIRREFLIFANLSRNELHFIPTTTKQPTKSGKLVVSSTNH